MTNDKSHDDMAEKIAQKVCNMCGGEGGKGACKCPAGILGMMCGAMGTYSIALSIVFSGLFIGIALLIALPGGGDNDGKNESPSFDSEAVNEKNSYEEEAVEESDNVQANAEIQLDPVTEQDHVLGSVDAPVKIVEYSDIECPYCQSAHPILKDVVDQYDGDVAWVYRHFPLGFHPEAKPAAIASECVSELAGNDAFWEFLDYLFVNQSTALNEASYEEQAISHGIDASAFRGCLSSGKYDQKIDDHMAGGAKAGVSGTPSMIIVAPDGSKYSIVGAQPVGAFSAIIDQHI